VDKEFKLGTIFFRDVNRDICFVEIPGMKFSPVKIRDSRDVRVGEQVYAVGNPEGLEKSISQGIISNKRQDRGGYVLQTDATVSFGSSGGGLFDQNGQLVGITNSVDRYSKNIAFALPSEWISQILFPKDSGSGSEKKVAATQNAAAIDDKLKSIKKIGAFGKANVSLYSYNNKCFVLLIGKNQFGETSGSAIWYPEKPGIILVFPNSTDAGQDFKIMNKVFYGDQETYPNYSGNFLMLGNKKYELVGVKNDDGRYPLLVTKLPADAKDQLLQTAGIDIKYNDSIAPENSKKISYDLDGMKDTLATYQQQCKVLKPSEAK
jgi:hypothetical protein